MSHMHGNSTDVPVKRKSFNQLHLCSSQSRHSFSARSDTVMRAVVTFTPCLVSQLKALLACRCLEQVRVMLLVLAHDAACQAVDTKAQDVRRSLAGTYCSSTAMTSGGSSGTCRDKTQTGCCSSQGMQLPTDIRDGQVDCYLRMVVAICS
jgi:hypothetical protein